MKKLNRFFIIVICTLAAGVSLFFVVPQAYADPVYLPNGDFESGSTNWLNYSGGGGELIGTFAGCYAGNCLQFTDDGESIRQTITPTERYVVVFAYLSFNEDVEAGDACINLYDGGALLGSGPCNEVGFLSGDWLWSCISNMDYIAYEGDIQLRLSSVLLNAGAEIYFDNVGVDYVNDCPGNLELPGEVGGPEWPEFSITATCPISLTTTEISGTETITTTETVTVPANILSNVSFENGGVFPDYWQSDLPLDAAGVYKRGQPGLARSGAGLLVVGRKPELVFFQAVTIPMSSEYAFGGHTQYANSATNSFTFAMRYDLGGASAFSSAAECENNGSTVDCNYEAVTGTVNLTPGAYDFEIYFPNNLANPNYDFKYYVDDAFLIPISGTLVNCPAVQEHYSQTVPPAPAVPPEGQFPVDTVGGIPVPVAGAGTVCYECRFPPTGVMAEPAWAIAWLGCVIRNLFSCSLRVWLYEIVNVLRATLTYLYVWGNWQSSTVQGGANWLAGGYTQFANYLSSTSSQITITISTGASQTTSWLDMLYLFVELLGILLNFVVGLLGLLFQALNILLQLVFGLFWVLWNALDVPAYTIADFNGGVEPAAGLGGYGPTNGKVFLGIMWGFQSIDNLFNSMGFGPLFSFSIGILGISVFRGMMRQWQSITPI